MNLRRATAASCLILLALTLGSGTVEAAPPAQDPDLWERANWWTHAGGDEIITLTVHPEDGRLLAGTDGGGLIVWEQDGGFEQVVFPNAAQFQASTVYDIAVDPVTGDVWLATDYGVAFGQGASGAPPSTWDWSTTINEFVDVGEDVLGVERLGDDAMPGSRVFSAVAVGADGRVYAGTPASGLAIRETDGSWRFVDVDAYLGDPLEAREGPADEHVADIAVLRHETDPAANEVWLVHGRENGTDAAISRYLPATDEWFHTPGQGVGGDPSLGPTDFRILDIAVDGDTAQVWLGTWNQGAFRYDPIEEIWNQYPRAQNGLCSSRSGLWSVDAAGGEAWVACGQTSGRLGYGVAHFDGTGWTTYGSELGLPSDIVSAVAIGSEGRVFLGNDNYDGGGAPGGFGIIEFEPGGTPKRMSTSVILPDVNELTSLAFDPQGRLWVGTAGAGLMRREADLTWSRMTRGGTNLALLGDSITDFLIRGDELWVSSTETIYDSGSGRYIDGGVSRYDLQTDTWLEPIQPADNPADGLPDGQISAMAAADDGGVWFGFGSTNGTGSFAGQGLAYYNEGDPDLSTDDVWIWWDPSLVDSMGGRTVLDLAYTNGELWAATSYAQDEEGQRADGGVSRLIGDLWERWPDGLDGFVTYSEDRITGDVRSVFADSRGYVWAGAYDVDPQQVISDNPLYEAVLNRFDPVSGDWEVTRWPDQGWVSDIAEDTFGRIWAGTTRGVAGEYWPADGVRDTVTSSILDVDAAEDGVFVYVERDGLWQALRPVQTGLADEQVEDIAIDPSTGYVWVAYRNHGLSEFQSGQVLGPTPTPRVTSTPRPTQTPCPGGACPSATPRPSQTITPTPTIPPTIAPVRTLPPAQITAAAATRQATSAPGVDPEEPEAPPEVPEPGTWLIFAMGLSVLGAWIWWRRNQLAMVG